MGIYRSYVNPHGRKNKVLRLAWGAIWLLFFRASPTPLFRWRVLLVRCFGGKVDWSAHLYPRVRIWAPWNLIMGPRSCLGNDVECYCVDRVILEEEAIVSQGAFLCTASHDLSDPGRRLQTAPVYLEQASWVFVQAYVGPGVRIGKGAVVGARAVVVKNVEPWDVVVGNPARVVRKRTMLQDEGQGGAGVCE